jgi:hypothetical protein
MATIRVLARGDILVLDATFAQVSGRRRFVGRSMNRFDSIEQVPAGSVIREVDPVESTDTYYVEGWSKNTTPVTVPIDGEMGSYFRKRVREGGLWPADAESATACCVAFDPTFGGDYPDQTSSSKRAKKEGE